MVLHYLGCRFGTRRDNTAVWTTVAIAAIAALVWAWPQGQTAAAAYAVASAVAAMMLFVALIVASLVMSLWSWRRRGKVVGYFDETATQLVYCHGSLWVLDKHFAVHPGRGEAAAFRRRVFTHIGAQADLQGVTVTMSTQVPTLRDRYMIEMPGLKIAASYRGSWHLERPPQKC